MDGMPRASIESPVATARCSCSPYCMQRRLRGNRTERRGSKRPLPQPPTAPLVIRDRSPQQQAERQAVCKWRVYSVQEIGNGHCERQNSRCRRIEQAAEQKSEIGHSADETEFEHDLEQRHFVAAALTAGGVGCERAGAITEQR